MPKRKRNQASGVDHAKLGRTRAWARIERAEGPPGSLPAANITPEGLKTYDEAKFFLALREGIRPSGVPINPEFMPWKLTKLMTDDEIRAVWKYLQTVPPKPYGNH